MRNDVKTIIHEHLSEISRLIDSNGEMARCECCGIVFDPTENTYGYCSDDCANSALD